MPEKLNPYSQKDCDCFNRTGDKAASLQELLNDLQECGIDCGPITEENQQTLKLAAALKAKFFPMEK